MRRAAPLLSYLLSLFALSILFYTYIDWENDLTALNIQISVSSRALRDLEEGNASLRFEIERLESPTRLIALLKQCEFSHLHFPLKDAIVVIDE